MGFQRFGALITLHYNMRPTKIIASIHFLILAATACDIPLNNKMGIPYSIQFDAPYVSSFEVDAKGDFYFSGADSVIRKISGVDQKVLFTKYVKGLRDGQLGLIGGTLWVVSKTAKSTVRLTGLNPYSGEIKSDTLLSFDRSLGMANGGYILDQKIIFSFADKPPTLNYLKIDPVSKIHQAIKNQNDIELGPDSLSFKLPSYLGKWDSVMVFSAPNTKAPNAKAGSDSERVVLIDKNGLIVGSKDFSFGDSEELFPSTNVSLVRISAGKVYYLRKKLNQKKAKIISVDLKAIPITEPAPVGP